MSSLSITQPITVETGIWIQQSLRNLSERILVYRNPDNKFLKLFQLPDRGRDDALGCAAPPSEPDVRFSRIRLSS